MDLTCLVEPNVPMDRLVEKMLEYGLMLPVIMEFPGITVGGGYAGTSGESRALSTAFSIRITFMSRCCLQIVKLSSA